MTFRIPAASAAAVKKTLRDCPAYRIAPNDSNYFAMVFDDAGEQCGLVCVVEIFDVGGKTPPNTHRRAHEMFFVLQGEGVAYADGAPLPLHPGDALLVRPGTEHVVENTGTGKLYCLTVMTPDEEFGALIRRGVPTTLTDADKQVLGSLALR